MRNAVRWLSEHHRHDPAGIEEAAMRFDLSPVDEAFLLAHFTPEGSEAKGADDK